MTSRALILALSLAAPAALAQGKPTLVDYPLEVKVPLAAAPLAALQDDFRQLLVRTPAVLLATGANQRVAVAGLGRQDCALRDGCLVALATAAGTLYALYASVEENAAGTQVTATGRVVSRDGLQVRAPLAATVQRGAQLEEDAREALGRLLAALALEKLPAALAAPAAGVALAPEALAAPGDPKPLDGPVVLVVPVLPPEPAKGADPLRVAAVVAGALAVASGGAAVGFGVASATARGALPADGRLLDAGQARSQAWVNQSASVALAGGLGAGVLAAAAVALWVAAPAAPAVALAPAPGGAQLTLSGRF